MLNTLRAIAQNIKVNPNGSILVHFWGFSEDLPLFEAFSSEMKSLYGNVLCVNLSDAFVLSSAKSNLLSKEDVYGDFDLQKAMTVIDLCRYAPTSLVTQLADDSRGNFVTFVRGIFAHATSNGRTFIQLRLPSLENAIEAGLTYEDYTETWKSLINIDYQKLEAQCEEKLVEYRLFKRVKLITDHRYELTMDFGERTWHVDAGNGDFPAGEIYIAPLESSVNGEFLADKVRWEGEVFNAVLFEFQSGTLVNCSVKAILDDLKQAPGDALRIAEFGIGLNAGRNRLEGLTGCTLFDEKMLGTCHIAVGMNHLFGGVNDSPVHEDFVSTDFKIVVPS